MALIGYENSEPFVAIAAGLTNYTSVHKYGYNASVGATEEDVWTAGATYSGFLTAASAVRIKAGGNAADTNTSGAGARTVTVSGLDSNWDEASETLTLAGESASSATSTSFIRVNRAFVATTGAYGGANTGVITIETTGGTVVATIGAATGQTEMAIWTVPRNRVAYLHGVFFRVEGTKPATCKMWQRPNADSVAAPFTGAKRLVLRLDAVDGTAEKHFDALPTFAAKTDLWCAGVVASNASAVTATFDVIYRPV